MEKPDEQKHDIDQNEMTPQLSPEELFQFLSVCEAIDLKDDDRLKFLLGGNTGILSKYLMLRVSVCSCGVLERIGAVTLDELRRLSTSGSCQHASVGEFQTTAGIQIIHWAAAHGTPPIVDTILSLNPDLVNSRTLLHELPPLAMAVVANNSGIVQTLIQRGARLDVTVRTRNSAVLDEIISRDAHLPNSGSTIGDIESWYTIDRSLFLHLISEDAFQADMLETFLQSIPCNLNELDERGMTPLKYVIANGNLKIISALLAAGVDPDFFISHFAGIRMIMPALFDAIELKEGLDVAVTDLLLKAGANPNPILNGVTPLHLSVQSDKEELVKLLLNHGADPNQYTNMAPILNAACRNAHRIVQLLVDHDADVNTTDGLSYTPLHRAAAFGFRETAEIILATGQANLELTTENHDATPLNLAAMSNNPNVLAMLVASGCDVRNFDRYGNTPLHYMCVNGCRDSVELLLAHGADPDTRNAGGASPLWNAVQSEGLDICRILLRYDVDLTVMSAGIKRGLGSRKHIVFNIYFRPCSLLWVAVERQNRALVDVLLNSGLDIHREKWILANYGETENEEPVMKESLLQLISTPTSLKLLCKNSVLHKYGRNLAKLSDSIRIPPTLLKWLTLV